jgi:hypothetical protein
MPSTAAAKGRFQPTPYNPQTPQSVFPPRCVVPAQPEAFPDVPSNPSHQPENRVAILGQAVVTPPAANVLLPDVAQCGTGSHTTFPAPSLGVVRYSPALFRSAVFGPVESPGTCVPRPSLFRFGTPERAGLAINDRIDIPTAGRVADLLSAHPRPRPRGSSASNARLTTSLMDNPLAAANVRTRRMRLCGSLTVNASLASLGGTGCFSR